MKRTPTLPKIESSMRLPTRQNRRRGTTGGFTLVELLTVLAIISLLAAILFPVFAAGREKARQSACTSNLRQLALANQMYAQDYDTLYTPAAQDVLADNRRWFGVRVKGRYQPKDGPLVPYLKENGLLRRCPSFRVSSGFDMGTGGYAYNFVGVGSRVWWLGFNKAAAFDSSVRESEIVRPAQIAMFSDGALDWGTGGIVEYGFLQPPVELIQNLDGAYSPDPSVHFRHQGRAAVVFVDAHVRSLPMARSTTASPVYAAANPQAHSIGWFGPFDRENPYTPD